MNRKYSILVLLSIIAILPGLRWAYDSRLLIHGMPGDTG